MYDVAAILRIRAVQSAGMAEAPRPVCGVKTLRPLSRQLRIFSKEQDKLPHDLGMELAVGTMSEEVLVLDGIKEGGVSLSGDDQSLVWAVVGHVELSVAIILRGFLLRTPLSCQQTGHEAGEAGCQPRGHPIVELAEGHTST
jgi:hypothetical protein